MIITLLRSFCQIFICCLYGLSNLGYASSESCGGDISSSGSADGFLAGGPANEACAVGVLSDGFMSQIRHISRLSAKIQKPMLPQATY